LQILPHDLPGRGGCVGAHSPAARREAQSRGSRWLFVLHAKLPIFEAILNTLAKTQRLVGSAGPRAVLERLAAPVLKRIAPTAKLAGGHGPAQAGDDIICAIGIRSSRNRTHLQTGPRVAYFHGCAANYFDDGVGDAVIAVLHKHHVEPLSFLRSVAPGRRSKPMATWTW
jgi:Fe-S oxidoreductase